MKSIVDKQAAELIAKYPGASVVPRPDGSYFAAVPNVPLAPGWNKAQTTVYFVVPMGYPVAKPDCFWADRDLTLAHGGTPANASVNTSHGGAEPFLWFSYHLASWNPNIDDFLTYVQVILQRLRDPR